MKHTYGTPHEVAQPLQTYRLSLLGPPLITGPGSPLVLKPTKAHLMLCFLAAQPQRMVPRTELIALFWDSFADGRHILRTNLNRLRQTLPIWPLRTMGDTVGWDPDAPCQVDALLFQSWLGALDSPAAVTTDRLQLARDAVALWRGGFLNGYVAGDSQELDDWLSQERHHWERQVLRALGCLATEESGAGNWRELLALCQQAIRIAPFEERFYRDLMRAYYRLGEPGEALACYTALERRLRVELDTAPELETTLLRDHIAAASDLARLQAPALQGAARHPGEPVGEAASPSEGDVGENLCEPARTVLSAAAIFDRGAPFDALCHVVGNSEEELETALQELAAAGWLQELADGGTEGGIRIRFVAEQVREHVYAKLSAIQRRRLHRRTFAYLAGLASTDADPLTYIDVATNQVDELATQLARHAASAELWQEAAHWCRVVAGAAERLGNVPLASAYLEEAIAHLERLPPSQSRREATVDLRVRLAQLGAHFNTAPVGPWNSTALREADLLTDSDRKLAVWLSNAGAALNRGQTQVVMAIAGRLIPLARLTRNKRLLAGVLIVHANTSTLQGKYIKALATLRECLAITETQPALERITAIVLSAVIHAATGDFSAADSLTEVLMRTPIEVSDGHSIQAAYSMGLRAMTAEVRGCWAETLEAALAGLRMSRTQGHQFHELACISVVGLAQARLGDPEGGLASIQQAFARAQELKSEWGLDLLSLRLAEVQLMLGNLPAARAAALSGKRYAQKGAHRYGVAKARKTLGLVLCARGESTAAAAELRAAVQEMQAMGARPEAARCLAALATAATTKPEREAARDQAAAEYAALDMAWDLQQLTKVR